MGPTGGNKPLCEAYPVNSIVKLTLQPDNEVVEGMVYCTDESSQTIVLRKKLTHTTLASEIRVVNAGCVLNSEVEGYEEDAALAMPLANVNKKFLEDRERKAISLAKDGLRHVNQKATPEGQGVFDKLLKACNVVEWKGESILVLNQIRVDPPYGSENCNLVSKGEDKQLDEDSLERVKRIVKAA
jgi:hypothetical protein